MIHRFKKVKHFVNIIRKKKEVDPSAIIFGIKEKRVWILVQLQFCLSLRQLSNGMWWWDYLSHPLFQEEQLKQTCWSLHQHWKSQGLCSKGMSIAVLLLTTVLQTCSLGCSGIKEASHTILQLLSHCIAATFSGFSFSRNTLKHIHGEQVGKKPKRNTNACWEYFYRAWTCTFVSGLVSAWMAKNADLLPHFVIAS